MGLVSWGYKVLKLLHKHTSLPVTPPLPINSLLIKCSVPFHNYDDNLHLFIFMFGKGCSPFLLSGLWRAWITLKLALYYSGIFQIVQWQRICQPMQEMWVWSLGQEDLLKKEMATHSGILAWKIPQTEEPGGLYSIGLQRVGHDWSNLACSQKKNWLILWHKKKTYEMLWNPVT